MATQVIQGIPTVFELQDLVGDQGWSISEGVAYHSGCNDGTIVNDGIRIIVGNTYRVTYTVREFISGNVNIILGSAYGISRTANGTYTEEITVTDNTEVKFFASGDLGVENLVIELLEAADNHVTVAYSERNKGFTSYFDYAPEMFATVGGNFYTFKNGQLYIHDTNPTRNNFYGQQYKTKVHYVSNFEPEKNKLYYSIKIDSNGSWGVPTIIIPANQTYPNGMLSRIKKGNFKLDDGKYWADFMRDMNDPNFSSTADALFNGRMLMGSVIYLELENDQTEEVKLVSTYIYTTELNRNF